MGTEEINKNFSQDTKSWLRLEMGNLSNNVQEVLLHFSVQTILCYMTSDKLCKSVVSSFVIDNRSMYNTIITNTRFK